MGVFCELKFQKINVVFFYFVNLGSLPQLQGSCVLVLPLI